MAHQNMFALSFHKTHHPIAHIQFLLGIGGEIQELENLLGSIVPCGKLTSKIMQKANTKVEINSMRRQSHSMAARLQKNGRAKQSRR